MPRVTPQQSTGRHFPRRAWLSLLALIAVVVWQLASQAGASSTWLDAYPSPGSTLPQPPAQVILAFDDPLDRTLSRIDVSDSQGQRRDAADYGLDPLDPARLTVSLRALPAGDYTVTWRAISALSGAVNAGSYRFRVGGSLAASNDPLEDKPVFTTNLRPLVDFGRLLSLLGAVVVFGGTVAAWWTLRGDAMLRWTAQLDRAFVLLVVGQILVGFALAMASLGCVASAECVIRIDTWLMDTPAGLLWMAQTVLALAFLVAARSQESHSIGALRLGLSAALAAVMFSWGAPDGVDVTLRIVHGWAMSIGLGLLILCVARPARSPQTADSAVTDLARPLSLGALAALALTGGGLLWRAIGASSAGWVSSNATLLILELCVVVGAGVLAVIRRRSVEDGTVTRWIGWLGIVAVGLGFLTTWSLGSGFQAGVGHPAQRVALESPTGAQGAEFEAVASLHPARAGANTFQLRLLSPLNAAPDTLTMTLVAHTAANTTSQRVTLVKVAPDRYELRLNLVAGDYQLRATSLANDAAMAGTGMLTVDPIRVAAFSGPVASTLSPWLILVLIPLVGFAVPLSVDRLAPAHRIYKVVGRVLGLACAVSLCIWLWQWQNRPRPIRAAELENPLPYSEATVAAGRDVYAVTCLECHGPDGAGDGPLARTLNQAPIDLRIHAQPGVHSDGTLFLWITQGIPGTPMPAFATALSEKQRWQLVHYLRHLARAGSMQQP